MIKSILKNITPPIIWNLAKKIQRLSKQKINTLALPKNVRGG